MDPHDVTRPFVRVGRIDVGCAAVTAVDDGTHVAIPIKDPRGAIETFQGRGPTLCAAVADALTSLSRLPFSVAAMPAANGHAASAPWAIGVVVRSLNETPRHVGVGHAVASDEATAVARATVRGLAVGGFLQMRLLPPGARDVAASTERIVGGIDRMFRERPLRPEQVGEIREIISRELHRFGAGQAIVAANAADLEGVLTRFDAQAALAQPEGEAKKSDTLTTNWWEWFPGLDNDDRTLRDVLSELPAAPAAAIPWIVRLFENPQGWLRLHGAVSLKNHDMIHILLGRGLLDQDEAFVIGFTMGSTKAVSALEKWVFKFIVSRLYPEPYRISRTTLVAYDLGVEAGAAFGVENLHLLLRDEMLDKPLGEIRRELQIDTRRLRHFYGREREALPGTLASLRLPVAE